MEAEYEEERKELLPNWLIKSLAWAFVAGGLLWVTALQGQVNDVKELIQTQDKIQTAQISEVKERVTGNDKKTDIHFQYIRDALNRIEAKLDLTEVE